MACLTVLLAVLAPQWAVQILEGIWRQLAIGAGVVLVLMALAALVRWRANRW